MYRDKMKDLLLFKNKRFIKVITGVRRCGKSTLLELYSKELQKNTKNNILYINFEEYKYQYINDKELYDIIKSQIRPNTYLLLDEIQRINKWELVINSLFAEYKDIDIYITGSNAYLLSSELSTYIAGRYVEIKLFPLSFKEFIEFNGLEPNNKSFNTYIEYGGMPSLIGSCNEETNLILDGICSSIIMKDIVEKVKIKDIKTLKQIILFLSDNIGNITSLTSIKNTLKVKNCKENTTHVTTIENYILALRNAFLFYEVSRYDIKGKELLKTLNKYYIVDIGLRRHLLGKSNDRGRILENIVFLELLRRDYKVYIGKFNDIEVDFIAEKDSNKVYFQVCETMLNLETRKRELKPLKMINDNFEKIILSLDETFLSNEDGIKHRNIIEWLV